MAPTDSAEFKYAGLTKDKKSAIYVLTKTDASGHVYKATIFDTDKDGFDAHDTIKIDKGALKKSIFTPAEIKKAIQTASTRGKAGYDEKDNKRKPDDVKNLNEVPKSAKDNLSEAEGTEYTLESFMNFDKPAEEAKSEDTAKKADNTPPAPENPPSDPNTIMRDATKPVDVNSYDAGFAGYRNMVYADSYVNALMMGNTEYMGDIGFSFGMPMGAMFGLPSLGGLLGGLFGGILGSLFGGRSSGGGLFSGLLGGLFGGFLGGLFSGPSQEEYPAQPYAQYTPQQASSDPAPPAPAAQAPAPAPQPTQAAAPAPAPQPAQAAAPAPAPAPAPTAQPASTAKQPAATASAPQPAPVAAQSSTPVTQAGQSPVPAPEVGEDMRHTANGGIYRLAIKDATTVEGVDKILADANKYITDNKLNAQQQKKFGISEVITEAAKRKNELATGKALKPLVKPQGASTSVPGAPPAAAPASAPVVPPPPAAVPPVSASANIAASSATDDVAGTVNTEEFNAQYKLFSEQNDAAKDDSSRVQILSKINKYQQDKKLPDAYKKTLDVLRVNVVNNITPAPSSSTSQGKTQVSDQAFWSQIDTFNKQFNSADNDSSKRLQCLRELRRYEIDHDLNAGQTDNLNKEKALLARIISEKSLPGPVPVASSAPAVVPKALPAPAPVVSPPPAPSVNTPEECPTSANDPTPVGDASVDGNSMNPSVSSETPLASRASAPASAEPQGELRFKSTVAGFRSEIQTAGNDSVKLNVILRKINDYMKKNDKRLTDAYKKELEALKAEITNKTKAKSTSAAPAKAEDKKPAPAPAPVAPPAAEVKPAPAAPPKEEDALMQRALVKPETSEASAPHAKPTPVALTPPPVEVPAPTALKVESSVAQAPDDNASKLPKIKDDALNSILKAAHEKAYSNLMPTLPMHAENNETVTRQVYSKFENRDASISPQLLAEDSFSDLDKVEKEYTLTPEQQKGIKAIRDVLTLEVKTSEYLSSKVNYTSEESRMKSMATADKLFTALQALKTNPDSAQYKKDFGQIKAALIYKSQKSFSGLATENLNKYKDKMQEWNKL